MEPCKDATGRTRIFYYDPKCSHQKDSIENNLIELRYICPKDINLYERAKWYQPFINSFQFDAKRKFNGKTSIEFIEFLHP